MLKPAMVYLDIPFVSDFVGVYYVLFGRRPEKISYYPV